MSSPNASSLSDDRLWEQYGRSVEEYRFQVDLNWKRAQYYFVLDAAVLVAAVGLRAGSDVPRSVVIGLFVAGVVIAVLALAALDTQHRYYTSARDLKTRLEQHLGLAEFALATTPGMGSRIRRLGRVRTLQIVMMVTLLSAHFIGLVVITSDALGLGDRATVEVIVRIDGPVAGGAAEWPVAVSRGSGSDTEVVRRGMLEPGGALAFRLDVGRYRISALVADVCSRRVTLTNDPLQSVTLDCRGG